MLLVFQGMDAAGKDSAIKSVFDGVNPQGCEVTSFKQPSTKETRPTIFLWRSMIALPERRPDRHLQHRSHYEECLVVRVHPENPRQAENASAAGDQKHLARAVRGYCRDGTLPPRAERHGDPEILPQTSPGRNSAPRFPSTGWKNPPRTGSSRWPISPRRALWGKYQAAYQEVIRHTSTRAGALARGTGRPQMVSARVVIGSTIVAALDRLDLHFPKVDKAERSEFKQVREGPAGPRARAG